jgi:hypothetical protein
MLTETFTFPNRSSKMNDVSLNPYLPWLTIKTIEAIDTNVGDISTGRQTRSHKQKLTDVSLMNQILDTSGPESYADAQGKLEWERDM